MHQTRLSTTMRFTRLSVTIATVLAIASASAAQSAPGQAATIGSSLKWYRGNTHTHTTGSDGDTKPADVVRLYRDLQYDFLVLSDHNVVTPIDGLLVDADPAGAAATPPPQPPRPFLLIPGQEVSDKLGAKSLHVNALGTTERVLPKGGATVANALQHDIDAIRAASGIPFVNHPNFTWAITAADLEPLQNVEFLEIHNAHPQCNNLGGGGSPGVEQIWDEVLSSGKMLWGVASDDMHETKRPWSPAAARPGLAWIMVRAAELTRDAILGAMRQGDFYASTGVELTEYSTSPKGIRLAVKEASMRKYRILFIGRDGKILKEELTTPAAYDFRGDEGYVRVKIVESYGKLAWTQPVVVPAR
jgi:hypothetical protein